jgi:hypothetical protein
MSCIENMFDTWINVLVDEVWTYEWTNITQILHLFINLCIKCDFNARYQCVKHMNYEWTNVTQISHLFINLCIKCDFNARYQCVKHMNYEWTKFAWFSLVNCEMLSLWCKHAQNNENLLNMDIKCWNSRFNARGSNIYIFIIHIATIMIG